MAESFSKTKQIALEMQQLIGGWEDMEQMLHNFADENFEILPATPSHTSYGIDLFHQFFPEEEVSNHINSIKSE